MRDITAQATAAAKSGTVRPVVMARLDFASGVLAAHTGVGNLRFLTTGGEATFSRASTATLSDGTLVASGLPRYEAGQFGRAVMVEEGTVNLVPLARQDFSGGTAHLGAVVTVTQNQSVPEWGTSQASRIQTAGGTHTVKYYLGVPGHGPSLNGQAYRSQVRIKNIGVNPVRINNNPQGTFVEVAPGASADVFVSTTGNGVSHLQLRVVSANVSDALDFLAFRPQVEAKPYATSFTTGTRAAESASVPSSLLNPVAGTIEVDFFADSSVQPGNGGAGWHMAFAISEGNEDNQIRLAKHQLTGNWGLLIRRNSGKSWNPQFTLANGWHRVAIAWDAPTTTARAYVDGVRIGETVTAPVVDTFANASGGVMWLGRWIAASNHLNTLIDGLRISSRARTDAELLAGTGKPLTADPDTTALLTFDNTLSWQTLGSTFGGDTYIGVGNFGGITAVEESSDIRPYGVKLTLSGIPTEMISQAIGEHYQGRDARLYLALLNDQHQVVNDPVLIWRGRMDHMDVEMGEQAVISLNCEGRLADWDRPRVRRYNDADQKSRYPGDRGLEFVAAAAEKELFWGQVGPK